MMCVMGGLCSCTAYMERLVEGGREGKGKKGSGRQRERGLCAKGWYGYGYGGVVGSLACAGWHDVKVYPTLLRTL